MSLKYWHYFQIITKIYHSQIPDVPAELSHGCYGFAAAYMHWPEQLIVGGATRNATSALRSARALQTVVQLMGEREMYEYWADEYRVHHINWNQEKAAAILDAWQRKFAAVSISVILVKTCHFRMIDVCSHHIVISYDDFSGPIVCSVGAGRESPGFNSQ